MNKFMTKIIGASLAIAMMIGVGVGLNTNKVATEADATSYEWQLVTAAPSDWSGEYILCSGKSGTVKMMDGSSFSSGACNGVDVTVSNNKITADDSDALTIAKSTTANKYTIKVNGKFIGKNANSNGIDSNTTWSTSLDNSISFSSGKVAIAGNGGRVLTWFASNSNYKYYAASNNVSQLFKKVEVPALSSIALSGDYQTEFTVGDSFNHDNMTVTATYSDNSTANVTASATWSGYNMATAGNQTVTVSYTERNITKTATYGITVVTPTAPFVSPEISSLDAATEQEDEYVSFTYGNINGEVLVYSDNNSVAQVVDYTYSNNEGIAQISFEGAGSANIIFEYDDQTLATIEVDVVESFVTITGLPASKALYATDSCNLASTITVNSAGIYSSNITWTSSNTSVATVNSEGVVNAVAAGTTNIKVASSDSPSVNMVCVVTVTEPLVETINLAIDSTTSAAESLVVWNVQNVVKMQLAKGNSDQDANHYYPGASNYTSTRFYAGQVLTLTPSPLAIVCIKAVFSAKTADFATNFKNSTFSNATASVSGTNVVVRFTNGEEPVIVTVGGQCGFDSVTFYYDQGEITNPNPYLSLTETIKTISGNESSSQQEASASFTFNQMYNSDTLFTSATSGQLTVTAAKGTGSSDPKYYTSGSALRFYGHNTITFTASANITQITFTFTQGSGSDLNVSTGTISGNTWTGATTSVTFDNKTNSQVRFSAISVTYQNLSVNVSNVALRFGAVIPTSIWTTINSSWAITDYGVIFARQSMMTERNLTTAEAVFRHDEEDVGKVHIMSTGTYRNPQVNGENYVFTARLVLGEDDYDEVFYAAPFIVAGGEYYFLQEEHDSVRTIANRCYTNGGSTLSQPALATLKGNN